MRVAKRFGVRNLVLGGTVAALTACATIESVHIARIELHQFASTTLTDTEHLTGQKEGKPVTLAGELRIPTLGQDPSGAHVRAAMNSRDGHDKRRDAEDATTGDSLCRVAPQGAVCRAGTVSAPRGVIRLRPAAPPEPRTG